MNTEKHQIRVGGVSVDLIRKKIKNLHLAVYPPNGRVRVSAPMGMSDEAIRLAIISRLAWIKKQRAKFDGQERQSEREFVTGESHYFQGRRYRLKVLYQKGRARVEIRNRSAIDLCVPAGSDAAKRKKVFVNWCRQQLKEMIPSLIQKWESITGIKVAEWGVKQMKTKWGSCNTKARRIWINLELVKKPVHCLEYIIVHEMTHILERRHNDRFTSLMDGFMPQWRLHKAELNGSPLRHEKWDR